MGNKNSFEQVKISPKAQRILDQILEETPELDEMVESAEDETDLYANLRKWVLDSIDEESPVLGYYSEKNKSRETFEKLQWKDYAAIRILDYIDHEGMEYTDPNLRGERYYNNPFRILWLAAKYGKGGGKPEFFEDMLHLFRQVSEKILSNIISPQCKFHISLQKSKLITNIISQSFKLTTCNFSFVQKLT